MISGHNLGLMYQGTYGNILECVTHILKHQISIWSGILILNT